MNTEKNIETANNAPHTAIDVNNISKMFCSITSSFSVFLPGKKMCRHKRFRWCYFVSTHRIISQTAQFRCLTILFFLRATCLFRLLDSYTFAGVFDGIFNGGYTHRYATNQGSINQITQTQNVL